MNTPGTRSTHDRLAELGARLEARSRSDLRRHRVTVGLVLAMSVVVAFGFSEVAALARNLDADTLAFMGRQQAESRLPEGRRALEQALQRQAPELVAEALESALDSIPAVRGLLVSQVNGHLAQVNHEFERTTLIALDEVLRSSRAAVDRTYPEEAFLDREMLMVHAAARRFREIFDQALDELYPLYSGRMRELTAQVQYLAHAPEDQLSSLDRKHREIVQTVLQLVSRAEDGGGF